APRARRTSARRGRRGRAPGSSHSAGSVHAISVVRALLPPPDGGRRTGAPWRNASSFEDTAASAAARAARERVTSTPSRFSSTPSRGACILPPSGRAGGRSGDENADAATDLSTVAVVGLVPGLISLRSFSTRARFVLAACVASLPLLALVAYAANDRYHS